MNGAKVLKTVCGSIRGLPRALAIRILRMTDIVVSCVTFKIREEELDRMSPLAYGFVALVGIVALLGVLFMLACVCLLVVGLALAHLKATLVFVSLVGGIASLMYVVGIAARWGRRADRVHGPSRDGQVEGL